MIRFQQQNQSTYIQFPKLCTRTNNLDLTKQTGAKVVFVFPLSLLTFTGLPTASTCVPTGRKLQAFTPQWYLCLFKRHVNN